MTGAVSCGGQMPTVLLCLLKRWFAPRLALKDLAKYKQAPHRIKYQLHVLRICIRTFMALPCAYCLSSTLKVHIPAPACSYKSRYRYVRTLFFFYPLYPIPRPTRISETSAIVSCLPLLWRLPLPVLGLHPTVHHPPLQEASNEIASRQILPKSMHPSLKTRNRR